MLCVRKACCTGRRGFSASSSLLSSVVFALDVFGQGYSVGETITALAMHLIPTAIILALLVVAWRWEWVGAVAFPLLGILYIAWSQGQWHWSVYVTIAVPLFLVGGLFLCGLVAAAFGRAGAEA